MILVIILSTSSQAKTLITIEYVSLCILHSCSALRVSSSSVSHSRSATESKITMKKEKKSELIKKGEKKENWNTAKKKGQEEDHWRILLCFSEKTSLELTSINVAVSRVFSLFFSLKASRASLYSFSWSQPIHDHNWIIHFYLQVFGER